MKYKRKRARDLFKTEGVMRGLNEQAEQTHKDFEGNFLISGCIK